MSSNATRGVEVRRLLLAIVKACAERSCPLPSNAMIGSVVGIDGSQVARHLNRMMNEGRFTTRQVGRRIYVELHAIGDKASSR